MAVLVEAEDSELFDLPKSAVLASRLFTKALKTHGGQGDEVELPFFDSYLSEILRSGRSVSMGEEKTEWTQYTVEGKGYLGYLRTQSGEGAKLAVRKVEAAKFGEEDGRAWYRNFFLCFGKGWVVFYFTKSENGTPWIPSFPDRLDPNWFGAE